jgi:hypothetical protein
MQMSDCVQCKDYPCQDVKHACYQVPGVELLPEAVRLVLISEAAPPDPADYYYAAGDPLFQRTTVQAFKDAGIVVRSIRELLDMGAYFTTAVKCGKTGYDLQTGTIKTCSLLLENELTCFPNVEAWMLMGDVAIKAVNEISRRAGQGRVIPSGSTYKIRNGIFTFRGKRAFPSYVQAGPSFFIEKSKRRAIAQDIAAAFQLLK